MKYLYYALIVSFIIVHDQKAVAQNLNTQIDKLISGEVKPNEPGAAVLVAKKGNIIYKKAFGMADMELDVPMKDSMVFYIGSNTKQFTAVATLQLIEQGKLSLNDSIGKYIKCNYPVSSITIRQLLSHTSGLGSNTETPAYKLIERKEIKPEELISYFLDLPMDFSSGSRWRYNNANFYILGFLIEKISGMSYGDYIEKNIFIPAGMFHSYAGREASIIKNRVPGYLNFRTGIKNTRITNFGTLYSSGSIQSTVEDMYKWNRALLSGKLLKPETLQLAQTRQRLADGSFTNYGFGWYLEELQGSPTIRHGGLVEGFTSETLFLPNEDVYVVMLFNSESRAPLPALARIIASQAINKPYSFTETPLDARLIEKYVGLYQNQAKELVNITADGTRLYWQRPTGIRYQIRHAANNQFFFDKDYLWVQFVDSLNNITKLNFSQVDIGLTTWNKTNRPTLNLYPEKLPDTVLNQLAGKYVFANNDTVFVEKRNSGLQLIMNKNERKSLSASSPTSFISADDDITVEFRKDELIIFQMNKERIAKKIL